MAAIIIREICEMILLILLSATSVEAPWWCGGRLHQKPRLIYNSQHQKLRATNTYEY